MQPIGGAGIVGGMSTDTLQRSPFHTYHEANQAKLVDFAGWSMPISYGSALAEHEHTRRAVSLFDVSHMGRVEVKGRDARRFLEALLTRRITDMAGYSCRYAMICNDRGGIIDDIIVYRYPEHWMMVVNASNRSAVLQHMGEVADRLAYKVKVNDLTEKTAMVAIQGPQAMEAMAPASSEIGTLKRYRFCIKNLLLYKITISRTGYTGEDGVEVILPAALAQRAVDMVRSEAEKRGLDIRPAGLAARDSLRIEAGMPLYGHEIDAETDPFTAGLGFAVTLGDAPAGVQDIPRFVGQDALEALVARGPEQQTIGLRMEGRRTPRQGDPVIRGEQVIGRVTSGCLVPTQPGPIAIARVPAGIDAGMELSVGLGNGRTIIPAITNRLPFER